jgi:beta-galactosidase/beta-glucuronidase
MRADWLCLNGEWDFEIDPDDKGLEHGLLQRALDKKIIVPFCPESTLSGIGRTDFMDTVWYRRDVLLPAEWVGKNVILHFQAVDYDATIWVNGIEVARHRGGFTPFSCDLRKVVHPGEKATIIVRARDDHASSKPRGKQSARLENWGPLYTRTTGIWQTVWLEPVPDIALQRPRFTPNVAKGLIRLQQPVSQNRSGLRIRATLHDNQGLVTQVECPVDKDLVPTFDICIPEDRRRFWGPGEPNLYDVDIELLTARNEVIDRAISYAGLRSVTIDGKVIKINGKPVFQRLVLDQGYYPDGVLTAPSDEALKRDIELSMAAGFNGARLHQKVFEERYLYYADLLGYLVWGEFPDVGMIVYDRPNDNLVPGATYITQWLEVIERDYSHPAIIGWCPLNETNEPPPDSISDIDDIAHGMYLAAKALDPTRPVNDASGYAHREHQADIYDCHDYEQDLDTFASHHAGLTVDKPFINERMGFWEPAAGWTPFKKGKRISIPYQGQPFFVSEFGGIWWNPERKAGESSWGYGEMPSTIDEFYRRFEGLCTALLDNPALFGYCYTQLTDVYQEQNGIYTFDRQPKFDLARIRRCQQRKAVIEKSIS